MMKVFGVAIAAALLAGSAFAEDKAPAGSAERGGSLFVELNCYSCHGTHGQGGGRGSEPTIPAGYPWAGFIAELRKPRRDMPAYTEKWVSNQDVADLYAYFSSLKPAPAAKDIPLLRQ
ncbi:MAG: c-type cytochrome [Burkholderiales bacterium]